MSTDHRTPEDEPPTEETQMGDDEDTVEVEADEDVEAAIDGFLAQAKAWAIAHGVEGLREWDGIVFEDPLGFDRAPRIFFDGLRSDVQMPESSADDGSIAIGEEQWVFEIDNVAIQRVCQPDGTEVSKPVPTGRSTRTQGFSSRREALAWAAATLRAQGGQDVAVVEVTPAPDDDGFVWMAFEPPELPR